MGECVEYFRCAEQRPGRGVIGQGWAEDEGKPLNGVRFAIVARRKWRRPGARLSRRLVCGAARRVRTRLKQWRRVEEFTWPSHTSVE